MAGNGFCITVLCVDPFVKGVATPIESPEVVIEGSDVPSVARGVITASSSGPKLWGSLEFTGGKSIGDGMFSLRCMPDLECVVRFSRNVVSRLISSSIKFAKR